MTGTVIDLADRRTDRLLTQATDLELAWKDYESSFCCEDDDGAYREWPEFVEAVADGGNADGLANDWQLRRLCIDVTPELQATARRVLAKEES